MTFISMVLDPVSEFLSAYGWFVLGAGAVGLLLWSRLRPSLDAWKQAREDAEYHKDPDKALAQMEAVQRARERQQQLVQAASERAAEEQKEREERKRAANLERLTRYGAGAGEGHRLGGADDGYLPLAGGSGGAGSSYRPPKRSGCRGGGCGR